MKYYMKEAVLNQMEKNVINYAFYNMTLIVIKLKDSAKCNGKSMNENLFIFTTNVHLYPSMSNLYRSPFFYSTIRRMRESSPK